ncbi:CD63 antigen-like [Bradysia coprophila]|uniref:CD63 antigen-like n=1 Tax=Bradysia coprophila TaxID=38358 RepID=UPI00187D7453|nr:CD63 antigen-like [Bradysia coprophila]
MKFNLGLTYAKYLVFLLNVVFVITSVLIVLTAIPTIVYSPIYRYMIIYGMQEFAIFWLVVGLISMTVALFGIFAAIRESTALANLYGVAMSMVYILQVAVMTVSFTIMSKARVMVFDQLNDVMSQYVNYRSGVDWIQSEFQCCGNSGSHDWEFIDGFGTAEGNETSLMPASCCVQFTNYVNLTCDKYHTSGCFEAIYQIVTQSMMLIGTLALLLSILQILAISLSFIYAQIIRYKKTERDMQFWNGGHENITSPAQ